MMKKLKLFAIVVSIMLILSVAAACGGDNGGYDSSNFINPGEAGYDEGKIVKEKITVTILTPKHESQTNWNNMPLWKEMERITNIRVNFNSVLLASYQQQRAMTWESTMVTDGYFLANNPKDITEYANIGAIAPLNDSSKEYGNLIDQYAPNYKQWMQQYPDIELSTKQNDGKIYSFAAVNENSGNAAKQYINYEWLKATNWYQNALSQNVTPNLNGKILPSTIQEFEEILKEFKKADTNRIPITFRTSDQCVNFIISAYGFVGTGIELDTRTEIWNGTAWVPNPTFNKIVWVPATDAYREALKTMRRWYDMGLLDTAIYENTEGTLTAKGTAGRLGSFSTAGAFLIVGKDLDNDYTSVGPLTNDYSVGGVYKTQASGGSYATPSVYENSAYVNKEKMWYQFQSNIDPSLFIISSRSLYKRELTRWFDMLYQKSMEPLAMLGTKGVHWDWDMREDGVTKGDGTLPADTWTFNVPDGQQRER